MQGKWLRWFRLLVMAVLAAWVASPSSAAQEQASASKVAMVNGSVITRADLDEEMGNVRRRLAGMGKFLSDSQLPELRKEVLETLINRELLYQESKARGIKVEEEAINRELKRLEARFPNEQEFKNALAKTNTSVADLRTQMKRSLAIKALIDRQFADSVWISDKEVRAYFDNNPDSFKKPEQMKAGHILIKVDPQADESEKAAARKKIEGIRKRLKKGEDFGTLAKEFSDDPSGAKGGDLGHFSRGQMVKPFEEAAFALKPGEISDVVETRFGYHLIKVTDKRPASTAPYGEVEERLQQYLKQKEVQKQVGLYVAGLKKKAKIETFLAEDP